MGDDYATSITLDGTQSGPALTLIPTPVDGGPNLQYLWTFSGSAYHIVSGTVTSSMVVVSILGDRPLQVDLQVTNAAGTTSDDSVTVSITLLADGGCPLGQVDAGVMDGSVADGSTDGSAG
jgi:hypothetical protein